MYPAEKVSLSLEEQHANRICINFLGQELLVQAVWGSEEGDEARVWPRLLAVTHIPRLGGKHSAAGRAGGAVPHFPAPTLHPWLCHAALFVPWVPLSFLPVHTLVSPCGTPLVEAALGPQLCCSCPKHHHHYSTNHYSSEVFPQHSGQASNSCTAVWDFCDTFCKQTPWELPAS